jgi:hypothetical protein
MNKMDKIMIIQDSDLPGLPFFIVSCPDEKSARSANTAEDEHRAKPKRQRSERQIPNTARSANTEFNTGGLT